MVNGLHLDSAFLTSGHSKHSLTILPNIPPFMHTFTQRRRRPPQKATASSSGAVRVLCLAQEHLDTQGGDRTSNLPVTSRPALPAETHAAHSIIFYIIRFILNLPQHKSEVTDGRCNLFSVVL